MENFLIILALVVLGFICFCIYFIFKILQFVIQATNLYKDMVTRQDMMIKILKDIRGGSNTGGQQPTDLNKCPKCNESITDSSSQFCKYCGVELDEVHASNYTLFGLILGSVISLAGSFIFLNSLSGKVLPPALQHNLIKIHLTIEIVSYSFALSAVIIAIIGMVKNKNFPDSATLLQFIAGLSFLACIIVGSVWANLAWGSYWSWDPKETWSLILFALFCCSFTMSYMERINDWAKLAGFLFTFIAILFVAFGVNYL